MTTINLTCTGASVQADAVGELTAGMTGIVVNIDFDAAWDGLTPTFYAGNTTDKAVPMAVNGDGMTSIPPEVMISGKELLIGARGVNAAGDIVLPTRWACCGMIEPSPDDAEKVTPKPPVTPDIVDQIKAQAYAASVNAAESKEAAEGAQLSAGESAASAAESAEAANRAAGEASGAKQAADEAGQKAATAEGKADTALSIASGASRAFTAETFQELQAWLRDPANAGKLMRGDNLYIVALDTPDYWVVSPLSSADPETGYYYRISPLETGKVDLSGYAKLSQLSPVATSGDYNDLKNKPTIPADQSKKIEELEKTSTELKRGLTQVEQLLPEAAPTVGKVLKVLAINEDGTFTCEWADGGAGGAVDDVQVNGTSVVADGVASIPLGSSSQFGLIKTTASYGMTTYGNGNIGCNRLTRAQFEKRTANDIRPITLGGFDAFVRSSLTHGINTVQDASGTTGYIGYVDREWTAEEQAAFQKMTGTNKEWTLKGTLSGAGSLTVDFSGCTEFVIKGRIKATGNSNLTCNLTTLLYNGAANADRSVYAHYIDCLDAIEPLTARHAGYGTVALGTSLTAYTINGKQVKDITSIYWAVPTAIDEATNLEVYAR